MTTLTRTNYAALLEEVQKALAEGRGRAKRALEREEIRTWWEAARIVNEHLRIHDGRAGYGKKVVSRLAADLGVTEVYLYDILRFQKVFPILNPGLELTLSHYRALSQIENPKERDLFFQKTVRKKLSVPELRGAIQSRRLSLALGFESAGRDSGLLPAKAAETPLGRKFPPLKPRRGKFYTYRIVKPRDLHENTDFYSVDLGFGNRFDLKLVGIKNPKEGEVIEAVRTEENPRGDRYRFKRVGAGLKSSPTALLYTYKAAVRNVYDDDTLWARIDLGFRFWHERKLRLRGIDAAEIEKGKPASDFVKKTLARVPFIVLSATGRDKFGRPLVDIFYLEGTEEAEKVLSGGTHLNQELLDRGLARRV